MTLSTLQNRTNAISPPPYIPKGIYKGEVEKLWQPFSTLFSPPFSTCLHLAPRKWRLAAFCGVARHAL